MSFMAGFAIGFILGCVLIGCTYYITVCLFKVLDNYVKRKIDEANRVKIYPVEPTTNYVVVVNPDNSAHVCSV